jgi:hypothetical protein
MKGRDVGFDGKGLLKRLWCFFVILSVAMSGLKREMAHLSFL